MTVSIRNFYGPLTLADAVGLERWQFERAKTAGMLPTPGHTQGWLPEQIDQVRELVPAILERFGTKHPIGASRCAEQLGERLGLEVDNADIHTLNAAGHLTLAGTFYKRGKNHRLYYPAEIDALDADLVRQLVDERQRWLTTSLTLEEASRLLGWKRHELTRVLTEKQISAGQFDRYDQAAIDALAADEELNEQIRLDRVVTADTAATEILNIERRHFDIAVEAGWITPAQIHEKEVGRHRTVNVPLYRTRDVLGLLDRPDINWARVRECGKGEKSPLLALVGGRKATRAKVIRSFLQRFGAEHGIEMWGWWVPGPDVWEIDWERIDGGPTKADVEAAITASPALRTHKPAIQLHSAAGAAIRFAREMLEPGVAVILDTETVSLFGAICEIAVIDAATGKTLLDTLVNPGVPITPDAQAIHGLTDADVTAEGVPDWPAVYKRLLRVTQGRKILAYNSDYDRDVIASDCTRYGIRRTRLTSEDHWADVMVPRSDHAHSRRWLRNGGGHRALGDVQQTRKHLQRMTAP